MAHPLTELRYDAGLSPEELGAEVKVSGRSIRRYEDGTRPKPQVAKAIADRFGVSPLELWPIKDDPPPVEVGRVRKVAK